MGSMAREVKPLWESHVSARSPCNIRIHGDRSLCLICGHQWKTADYFPCPYHIPKFARGGYPIMGFILILSSLVALCMLLSLAYYLI